MTANNFDWKAFLSREYEPRTADVELSDFGGEKGNTVVFQVRGLDAIEVAKINESVERNRDVSELIDKLSSDISSKEKAAAIAELLGLSDEKTPDRLVREYGAFEMGVTSPKPETRADVIKFARVYPAEFRVICTRIFGLTGLGQVAKKKPKNSTEPTSSEMTS